MYQSCYDVHFYLIWRDATESILVKLEYTWKIMNILWKKMIVIWMIFSIAYRIAKVILQKGRQEGKDSLSKNIEGKHNSVHQKEDSGVHSPT